MTSLLRQAIIASLFAENEADDDLLDYLESVIRSHDDDEPGSLDDLRCVHAHVCLFLNFI